jgi:hypothetical protein
MPSRLLAFMSFIQTLFLAVVVSSAWAQAGPSADAAVGGAVVKAYSFGFDPADATRALQAAIDSGAAKVIVDNLGKPWIVDRIALASNQEVCFEKGTEVLAKPGAFQSPGDALFRAHLKQNITPGGSHHKSLSEEHLFEVGVIPTGSEALVLYADLQRVVVLQQAQRCPAQDTEVGVGMAQP